MSEHPEAAGRGSGGRNRRGHLPADDSSRGAGAASGGTVSDADGEGGYDFAAFYADRDVSVPTLDASMLPVVVADLSATSEVHERRFDTLGEKFADLDARASQHAETVQGLSDGFAALEAALIDKANLATPSRWAWQFLTQKEASQLWLEVRWFVDSFVTRYPLKTDVALPPCWYRHSLALDELTAVYAAWREAFCGGDRPTTSMTSWWDRWLWPALHRLSAQADWRECKLSRLHVAPAARQETTDAQFDDFVATDLAGRPIERATPLPWPAEAGTRSVSQKARPTNG